MATAKGSQAQLIIIEEATYGTTPGTPTGYKMPISGISGDWMAQNLIGNPEIRGNRNPAAPVLGNVSVNGSFDQTLHLDAFGWIQKHGIGDMATTGSDPYTHISKVGFSGAAAGDMEVGLTVEIGYTDIDEYLLMTGCRISTLGVHAESEGVSTISVGVVGQDFTVVGSSEDATPTEYTSDALGNFAAALDEGGSSIAYVQSVDFTLNNTLDSSLYVIGGSGQIAELPEGIATLEGTVTALFQSSALLDKAVAGTETSLTLTWTDSTHSLELSIPEMLFQPSAPTPDAQGAVLITLPFQAYYGDHADATLLKATLVNDVATY